MRRKFNFNRLTKQKDNTRTMLQKHKREMLKFDLKKAPLMKKFEANYLDLPDHLKKMQGMYQYRRNKNNNRTFSPSKTSKKSSNSSKRSMRSLGQSLAIQQREKKFYELKKLAEETFDVKIKINPKYAKFGPSALKKAKFLSKASHRSRGSRRSRRSRRNSIRKVKKIKVKLPTGEFKEKRMVTYSNRDDHEDFIKKKKKFNELRRKLQMNYTITKVSEVPEL